MSGYDFDRDYLPRILSGSRSGLTESTRPKTSITFIDEGNQDARDIWSDSAIDKYGKGKHSKHHYSKKRRPISADSSVSSVSSISEFNEEVGGRSFLGSIRPFRNIELFVTLVNFVKAFLCLISVNQILLFYHCLNNNILLFSLVLCHHTDNNYYSKAPHLRNHLKETFRLLKND